MPTHGKAVFLNQSSAKNHASLTQRARESEKAFKGHAHNCVTPEKRSGALGLSCFLQLLLLRHGGLFVLMTAALLVCTHYSTSFFY
jgi:hypothetical protein